MWTLTFAQVGTIVIVALLCGAAAQAGFAWLLRWTEQRVDRMVDEGRAHLRDEPLGQRYTLVTFDEAHNLADVDVERIVNLNPSLGRGGVIPPRRLCDPQPGDVFDPPARLSAGEPIIPARYRLDRWVAPDSDSTTPHTEGDAPR